MLTNKRKLVNIFSTLRQIRCLSIFDWNRLLLHKKASVSKAALKKEEESFHAHLGRERQEITARGLLVIHSSFVIWPIFTICAKIWANLNRLLVNVWELTVCAMVLAYVSAIQDISLSPVLMSGAGTSMPGPGEQRWEEEGGREKWKSFSQMCKSVCRKALSQMVNRACLLHED